MLIGADSPLEFARLTVRDNGDVTNRSQAAHMNDHLQVANNVIIGLKCREQPRPPNSYRVPCIQGAGRTPAPFTRASAHVVLDTHFLQGHRKLAIQKNVDRS